MSCIAFNNPMAFNSCQNEVVIKPISSPNNNQYISAFANKPKRKYHYSAESIRKFNEAIADESSSAQEDDDDDGDHYNSEPVNLTEYGQIG